MHNKRGAWNAPHARHLPKRINHQHCYPDGEACTNQAELLFSRPRRAEIGMHHHAAGPYLGAYGNEIANSYDAQYTSEVFQSLVHLRPTSMGIDTVTGEDTTILNK